MKHLIAGILMIAFFVLLGVGCGKGQESVQPKKSTYFNVDSSGSITNKCVAIPVPGDVRMVVFQAAGYRSTRQGKGLKGEPKRITNRENITAIVNAIKNPDGHQQTREFRNDHLAIVAENGVIVMFGITPPTVYYTCDISREHSSNKLSKTLAEVLPKAQVVRLELGSPIRNEAYSKAGKTKQLDLKAVEKPLGKLLKLYRPFVLQGNRHCSADEVLDHAKDYPEFIAVRLARLDSIEAIVTVKDTIWPPETYNTNTRLERIAFDTITIFRETDDQVRFVFADSKSDHCLFTDPVKSIKVVQEAQGKNPKANRSTLFDDVSMLK